MALLSPTFTRPVTEEGLDEIVATWPPAAETDTFAAISLPQRADRTFQVWGTFGGATLSLNGSNDSVHYSILHDAFGNDVSLSASGIAQVTESSLWVQPITQNGSGSSVTVVMTFRRVLR